MRSFGRAASQATRDSVSEKKLRDNPLLLDEKEIELEMQAGAEA